MARLRTQYETELKPQLMESLGLSNVMAIPRLEKITVSCGVGKAKDSKKLLQDAVEILNHVTGQKSMVTKARRPIAQFKLREGMPVGCMVTLRGDRAYEFLDRLISVVIPRIRDFRGLPRKVDGQGNYNMGIAEQSVFPEIGTELLESPQGMNIAITIRNGENGAGVALLEAFSFPFRREEETVG
jgi:large subunit ribosomal protein L5